MKTSSPKKAADFNVVSAIRAKHLMSLREATRRGNLPEGTPYYIYSDVACRQVILRCSDICLRRDICPSGKLRIIICHCEASPEREPYYKTHARYCITGPNGILCTRWEKEYASVRQTFVACDDCLVKNEAYDAEKKAHTSKRVSIIACYNVISKAQCAPRCLNICS